MSINNKKVRRLSTAMVAGALTITLASCSAATNKYGNLDRKATYASVGDYKLTNGELWDELQWNAKDVLDSQIYNVIVDEQITRLTKVINTGGTYSKLEDKKIIHNSDDEISEDAFNDLYKMYRSRLADYVVQDVFNFVYEQEDYWTKCTTTDQVTRKELAKKYADEMYVTYQKSSVAGGDTFEEILNRFNDDVDDVLQKDTRNADSLESEENIKDLSSIAIELSELYYPLYAKELFTYDKLKDDVKDAFEDDDDDEDEVYGLYKNSEYIDMFKQEHTNKYNVNLIKIKFASATEFTDTLRAFGLYMYSTENKFYYIYDDKDDQTVKNDYTTYITHYKDFTGTNTSKNLKTLGAEEVPSRAVLDIYIMLYNYMYGGYLPELESAIGETISFGNLNELRDQTLKIINKYKVSDQDTLYNNTVELLKQNDDLTYTPDQLEDTYTASFKNYCFETLKLKDDDDYDSYDTRYSTTLQSGGDSSFAIYKFDDTFDELSDKELEYETFYRNKDNTSLDYFEYLTKEENKELFDEILEALVWHNVSESIITSTINTIINEDVKVKVYNEATEIAWAKEHDKYSKSVGSAKNKNILATIKYNGKTFNLNIKANDNDAKSLKIAGTDSAFGVYDYLERKSGATTAIDLLSKKMIKDTKQYKEALKDKDQKEIYNTYLKNILTAFANDGYSSNGYPSSIGKYNFLMLYFHTANVNKIIKDYYLVQATSSKLLTDYSNSKLAEFFKEYSDVAHNKYFSLSGKRLVIYMDKDEDGKYDDADTWLTEEKDFDGTLRSREEIAKLLAYEFYKKISAAANTSHATKLEELVDEYNNAAKAEYNDNPTATENVWAKYKKLGFNVAIEDVSATNSTTNVDYAIKERLYAYKNDETYQYFINHQIPSEYIENITQADTAEGDDTFVTSKDGINLLIVTSGTDSASAEWKQEDFEDTPLKNIVLKYNEKYVTISDIYNETDTLNENQIKLYIIDNAINGASTLSPSTTATALSSFLAPVYSRYTSSETQRIVLLYFMESFTNSDLSFANESYNGNDGFFNKLVLINREIADDYIDVYNEYTKDQYGKEDELVDLYPEWWEKIENQIKDFLIDVKEAE